MKPFTSLIPERLQLLVYRMRNSKWQILEPLITGFRVSGLILIPRSFNFPLFSSGEDKTTQNLDCNPQLLTA
jgi:hypothetical protein